MNISLTIVVIVVYFTSLVFGLRTGLLQGRYTRNIFDYQLSLPHRVSSSGAFITFSLPQYFKRHFEARTKRGASEDKKLYYNIIFNGKDHHVELWPNHGFVSPNLVKEVFRGSTPVNQRKLERFGDELCHYVGHVKGDKKMSAAMSLCHGMAGYVMTDKGQYFIEPIAEHQPNSNGEHVHVIYKREQGSNGSPFTTFDGKSFIGNSPICGTREKWTEAWMRRLRDEAMKKIKREEMAGNMHSQHRYLEILVVVDKKFIDYHRSTNIETYILTIMNMVSRYYHDSSVGNQIDVHVVRVIYLEKPDEHLDLEISKNAEVTLDSFCAWAKSVNPKDKESPQHHDIAVLMTRYDLCSDNVSDCNLMGLAYLASACDPDKSCAINEDSGLALGITVTHEVGHVMGCGHDNDGEDSPCKPQNPSGEYYVMSPYVHMQTTEWSSCSKKFMTELFEYASTGSFLLDGETTAPCLISVCRNQLGECLNNVPQDSLYKETDMLPGSVYDADYQCNEAFPGFKHCVLDESKICEMLYCNKPGSMSCSSKGQPPADGTKCGEKMWCYNTKCVEMGQRPASVDGGWGEWCAWSECSRSCGGGISYSERSCNNPVPAHGGRFCIGERKRVKLCNTDSCPAGGVPYRDQQCTEFDNKPFRGQLYKWKPFFVADNPCQLNCINENHVYVALAPRVKDGTSCKPGTKYKCIFGVCRKVGCDFVIDSNAVEDVCGICNGDGTHCTVVDKVFTALGSGYMKITTIPAGSLNIHVNELAASENTIAVSDEHGKHFYLNPNFSEEANGDKDFGGVRGLYDHPSEDKETLYIAGPILKPLILHAVFYNRQQNPGIHYKYSIKAQPVFTPEYIWEFLEYGECSARCGPGLKTSHPSCVERRMGKVGDKFCEGIEKPEPKTMECNVRPCQTEWRPRGWGECSGCDGKSGTHNRTIDCVQESSEAGKDPVIVDDYLCKHHGTKPAKKELCCSDEPCKKCGRSLNEFERKLGGLAEQLKVIKERRKAQQEELNENNERLTKDKWRMGRFAENNVKKYHIAPQLRKRFEGDISHFNKYRKLYAPGKRSSEDNCKDKPKKFIDDHLPPEGNTLMEVPIKESSQDVKLSDEAFESEGDKVSDTLDFCNAKIFTGKRADEEIKRLKKNSTRR